MDTEAVGQAAYTLRGRKGEVRYCWVIERADRSACFRLARKEWRLAEEILHNLLHEFYRDGQSRRDAA